jgi:hypothetical protein
MQYPVPPLVAPADPFDEQPMWRLATIRPNHPRFKHLPLVKRTSRRRHRSRSR